MANRRFLFHPTPSAVFAPQQIRHQVQFSASTVPTDQDKCQGKIIIKRKGKTKQKPNAADWFVSETNQLLHAQAPCFERLKGASNKVCTVIWNEIYEDFKSSWDESEHMLPQVKKGQQILEYEF